MTAKTKVPNYSDAQTAELLAAWALADTDEKKEATKVEFATKFGKGVRSIVAKLSREDVYQAKAYVSKTGVKPVKKDAHADAIGAILSLTEAEADSLTKANKTALVKIFTALANSKPMDEGLTEAESASLKRCSVAVREKVFAALDTGEISE